MICQHIVWFTLLMHHASSGSTDEVTDQVQRNRIETKEKSPTTCDGITLTIEHLNSDQNVYELQSEPEIIDNFDKSFFKMKPGQDARLRIRVDNSKDQPFVFCKTNTPFDKRVDTVIRCDFYKIVENVFF